MQELNLKGDLADLSDLYKITKGKPDMIIEMIEIFIVQVEEFKAAVDDALKEVQWEKIYFSAHRFKSSFNIFGITGLSEKFNKLQILSKEQKQIADVKLLIEEIIVFSEKCVSELHRFINNLWKSLPDGQM